MRLERYALKGLLIVMIALVCGCSARVEPAPVPRKLCLLWAKWAPADALQELTRKFTAQTGIVIKVKQVPWDQFYDEFLRSLEGPEPGYDMVGGDSQWLGRMTTSGAYTDLSSWIRAHRVEEKMTAASMAGYSEYPQGSGRFWAVPLMGDAIGFAYRRDLFEKPQERENFRARYGYDLDVPETWKELRDIAEFFYRPKDGLYGANMWGSRSYDAVTMGMESFIWSYGSSLGNSASKKVRGYLNTPESERALEMYREIYRFGAPEWSDAYLDTTRALISGRVVMVMGYFAFFPALTDPGKNPYSAVTGFFANPAGPKARVSSLGGQGLSLVSRSKNKEDSLLFLEWFIRPEVQQEWARLGGFTCDRTVLDSREFLAQKPYNPAFRKSMNMVRDFWVVPEYPELLEVSQKYFYRFLAEDNVSAKDTLNAIAREWEDIFEIAGYYTE